MFKSLWGCENVLSPCTLYFISAVPASTAPSCSEVGNKTPAVVPTRPNLPGVSGTPARSAQPGTAVQTPHLQQPGKKTAMPEKPPQACTQPQSPPYCHATPPALASVSSDKVWVWFTLTLHLSDGIKVISSLIIKP